MPRTVLLLHSSAGLYGADVQLAAIVRGLDPGRWRAVCVLPERGRLAPLLEQAGAEVVVHPLAVLRRALATPAGALGLARAVREPTGGCWARWPANAGWRWCTTTPRWCWAARGVARAAGAAHVVHVREIWTGGGPAERALWPLMRRRLLRRRRAAGHLPGRLRPVPARGRGAVARRPPAQARSGREKPPPGRSWACRPTASRWPWSAGSATGRATRCWPAAWPSPIWPDRRRGRGCGRRAARQRRRGARWTSWQAGWASATGWCGWASARTWKPSWAPRTRLWCPPRGPSRWGWWRWRRAPPGCPSWPARRAAWPKSFATASGPAGAAGGRAGPGRRPGPAGRRSRGRRADGPRRGGRSWPRTRAGAHRRLAAAALRGWRLATAAEPETTIAPTTRPRRSRRPAAGRPPRAPGRARAGRTSRRPPVRRPPGRPRGRRSRCSGW